MTALSSRERLGPTNTFSRKEFSIGEGLSTRPRSTTFSGSNSPRDNVSDLFVTPAAPVRWCKLLGEAEPNKFEPSKPATWSCELILDPKDTEHMAWMQAAEQHFIEEHGDNAKRSSHWLSIAKDKDDPEKACAKFKIPCFIRKDMTKSPGPTVMVPASNLGIPTRSLAMAAPFGSPTPSTGGADQAGQASPCSPSTAKCSTSSNTPAKVQRRLILFRWWLVATSSRRQTLSAQCQSRCPSQQQKSASCRFEQPEIG